MGQRCILFILILLYFSLAPLMANGEGADQIKRYALVVTPTATIYADASLESPIGYIKSGRIIRVGLKAKSHGKSYPIIIKRKIAYIAVKALSL